MANQQDNEGKTGLYTAPVPFGIWDWRGQLHVTTLGMEFPRKPHADPVPPVTSTQFELVEGPHNQLPRNY